MVCGTRVIYVLAWFSLFFLGFQAEGAATPVPRQLYGKSVSISWTFQQTLLKEIAGKSITLYGDTAVTFYFSPQDRIFARRSNRNQFGSRTYEQVGSDPRAIQHPKLAAGSGQGYAGTGAGSFQDLHFEGRALIAVQRTGENGALRRVIEFDQNFASCTWTTVWGRSNGKPVRQIGWRGDVEQIISSHATNHGCVIRDGNALEQ